MRHPGNLGGAGDEAAGSFPATRLSVIEGLRSEDEAERERAMDDLCGAYWRPIYKYLRLRWTRNASDAQDVTQGFFAELLERELLARFDPAKSRLRTYLRVCVDSFVLNESKAAQRLKRGGGAQHLSLDFAAAEHELSSGAIDPAQLQSAESLEEFFEKEWIRSLFGLALEDLRALCDQRNRERTFALFEAYDLEGEAQISYQRLADEYGIEVTDVTNALAWARREFRRLALERLQALCATENEYRREAKSVFGWDTE